MPALSDAGWCQHFGWLLVSAFYSEVGPVETTLKTDVLVVGAGPTGLALATQLIRHGVDFAIIDTKETTTPYSKAIGVQARTLEIYEQIELAQRLIDQGNITRRVRLIAGGEQRATIELSKLGEGMSPYPFLLIVEQGKHEAMLNQFINDSGKHVRWQTQLESFTQNANAVTANIVGADGVKQMVEAKYLVGCDGAKSLIRHSLGLKFEGSTFERTFYVADVQIKWQFLHDMLTACLGKDRVTAFFPMPGEDRYRIVGVFPEGFDKNAEEVLYDEIERQILEDTQLTLDIYKVNWFSSYKVHSRRVNSFSVGGCFLAGDAAHIHSPAGAQGMNTGIQDGYNLAWKLAEVLKGNADQKILATYNDERIEVAKRLLETTDRMFDLFSSPDTIFSFIRLYIFPHVANFALSLDSVNQFVFPIISQTGIHYRHSPLSQESDDDLDIKAGDRMPYFLVDDRSIYDQLREPAFHLLTFARQPEDFEQFRIDVEQQFGQLLNHLVLPLSARVMEIFDTDSDFNVLLRPDNYIGFISRELSLKRVKRYFTDVMGTAAWHQESVFGGKEFRV